jgi:nucleotide-binding universal stress UspA family protein
MGYVEILVQTGAEASDAARTALAAELAHRFGASLTGAHPTPATPIMSGFEMGANLASPVAEASMMQLVEQETEENSREASEAETAFRKAAEGAGVASSFVSVSGDDPSELTFLARRADLTVLPATDTVDVAMGAGGPVLFIHPETVAKPFGERVLVAWNGSRECSRALKDALPILKAAKHIEVVVVGHEASASGAEQDVPAFLEKHGCNAQARRVAHLDLPVGEVLLRTAHQLECDLIVMGLYGHARLQESVMGGASHDVIRHARMPVFMSH